MAKTLREHYIDLEKTINELKESLALKEMEVDDWKGRYHDIEAEFEQYQRDAEGES